MWMDLNPAMLAWIPRIKQAGFRLGILSNMGDGVLGYMRPRFPWLAQFDHLTWSCELGVVKPDPAIYLHTVKKLGVSPDQALFIDNLEKNIVGAEAVGLHAALFQNVEQLQSDLARRGFPLPPDRASRARKLVRGTPEVVQTQSRSDHGVVPSGTLKEVWDTVPATAQPFCGDPALVLGSFRAITGGDTSNAC